jgi:hypothetical protein
MQADHRYGYEGAFKEVVRSRGLRVNPAGGSHAAFLFSEV